MLSSISSYLFGSSSPEAETKHDQKEQQQQQQQEEAETCTCTSHDGPCKHQLKTRATDDEWVLVDKSSLCNPSGTSNIDNLRLTTSDDHQESGGSSPLGSPRRPTVVVSLTRSVDRLSDTSTVSSPSGASTPVHVVYPSMEESWLVTPPPCFTAEGSLPAAVETGPMENLLIEHPSMSVYGPRGRQSSAGVDTDESESESEEDTEEKPTMRVTRSAAAAMASTRRPPHRTRAVAACAGLLAQVEGNRAMQVVKQRQEKRSASRNKLGRSNKVSQYQSQNKHKRRKHYMSRPSGRSNNRRC